MDFTKKTWWKPPLCQWKPIDFYAKSHGLGAGPPDIQHLELLRPSVALVAVGVRVALLLVMLKNATVTSPSLKKCHEEKTWWCPKPGNTWKYCTFWEKNMNIHCDSRWSPGGFWPILIWIPVGDGCNPTISHPFMVYSRWLVGLPPHPPEKMIPFWRRWCGGLWAIQKT